MKLHPPDKYVIGKITNVKRYYGRIKDHIDDKLVLTAWEFFGNRRVFGKNPQELFFNVFIGLTPEGLVTKSGKRTSLGGVVEIWSWRQFNIERVHLKVIL